MDRKKHGEGKSWGQAFEEAEKEFGLKGQQNEADEPERIFAMVSAETLFSSAICLIISLPA